MTLIDLAETAAGLPKAWSSHVLGRVGTAAVKVLRMDELPVSEETHEITEALLVVEGRLELVVAGRPAAVGAGELYLVPAGTPHTVGPGSRGTLVIIEVPED